MKKRTIFVALVAVCAMMVVVGCSDSKKTGSSKSSKSIELAKPEPVVALEKWLDAILDYDLEGANKYSTEQSEEMNTLLIFALMADEGEESEGFAEEFKSDVEEMIEDGCEIDESVAYIGNDEEGILLVKEDGQWKVDITKE